MTPSPRRFRKASGTNSKPLSLNDDPTGKVPTSLRNTRARQTNCVSDFSEWRLRMRNDGSPPSCFSVKSRNGVWSMAGRWVNRVTPISHQAYLGRPRSPALFRSEVPARQDTVMINCCGLRVDNKWAVSTRMPHNIRTHLTGSSGLRQQVMLHVNIFDP